MKSLYKMAASSKDKRTPITTPLYQVPSVDVTPDPPIFSLVTTFKEPRNRFPSLAGRYDNPICRNVLPGRLHRLAESIPQNRFLGSINVYKYGLGVQVLPMQDCSQLITTRNYNYVGKNELCAGRKKKFKTIQLFKKEGDKYTAKGNITNFMGI